ncbi:uncharacterized protein [Diadema antillarum]|uniref:uncharacterized protein n=1 Tax=Diadema antillarum TaxID=105358 RepID=UPI003A8A206D
MFASMEFWQSLLSPTSHSKEGGRFKSRQPSLPKMKSKKKKKQDSPPKRMEQSQQGKGQKRSTPNLASKSGRNGSSQGCHGNLPIPSNVDHHIWEVFTTELDSVTSWLTEAVQFTDCWKAPSHSIPSIRVQLERHLAFSLEVQTHKNQTERIVFQGQDIADQSPNVARSLGPRLESVVAQWNQLERSLDIQSRQIQEALSVVETSISTGLQGNSDDLLVEETRDAIEFMRMKLRRNQGRSSPVTVSISQTNNSNFNSKEQSVQSSRFSPATSNPPSCSSSPEFEVLYNELSDWLDDMHLAVSDSADMRVSEHHKQHMCKGYEQEMQLREVSRSKLQRKGLQLMASKPSLVEEVGAKLGALNQQWQALQQHIAPSPLLARKSSSTRSPNAFSSSEQAMSMAIEVDEAIGQLKTWLTHIEGRLFETEGSEAPQLCQLENRLQSLEELCEEIESHSQGVGVVLELCSLLQEDDLYLSSHQRERETLQLGAINVERRWQNVRMQSQEILAHTRERMESMKVAVSGNMSDEEQRPQTPDLPFIMEESLEEISVEEPSLPSWIPTEKCNDPSPPIFCPSGAKDDDVVDGYGNRTHDHGRSIEYEDILIAREAFSENDAFSISDASEVSAEDFAFDDHLPLKYEEEEEEGELDDDLALPLSETPDIMELTDEMLDAYLQLEEDRIQEVEAEMAEDEKTSKAAEALEFWSMSPREDHMLKAEELDRMRAALRQVQAERGIEEEEDGENTGEEERMSLEIMCNAYAKAISNIEEHHGRLGSVGSDFLSEEAEEALECLASDDDIGDEYDGDLDDDCFLVEDSAHDVALPDCVFMEETQEFNDDYAGWMIGSMEDVAECPDSLEMDYMNTPDRSESSKQTDSSLGGEEEEEEEEKNETIDDLPELCPEDSIFASADYESSSVSSSPLLSTWPLDSHQFSPPISEESSTNSLFSSLRSLSSAPELGAYLKSTNLIPSLVHVSTDDSLSEDRQTENSIPAVSHRRKSLGQRTHSQWSNDATQRKVEEKDNLLEITDISLTHMYESLDFVTELVHQIAPEEKSRSHNKKSRFDSFTEAIREAKFSTPHQLSDSFDIVSSIVRKMVPTDDDQSTSVEESTTASEQTHANQEVNYYSQSEDSAELSLQEVESCSAITLSDSLSNDHSLWNTCTGSFNFTWPASTTAHCDSCECKELASIQAAVKHTLSKALQEDDQAMERSKKSKKHKRNKRKSGSTSTESSAQNDGTEGSVTGSCDTGFHSLMSVDDEKSSMDASKITETDSPCTVVDENDESANKSGYMSYISQLAEACSEGNLDQYLSSKKHKQCYLWSVPPAAKDTPEELALKADIAELEETVSDLLVPTEELESKWDLNSQASNDTDQLMEATNHLVEELKSGGNLDVDDLREDQVGSWKDVIVLWMDKNGKMRDTETQGCTPITISPDYLYSEDGHMTPIIEEITSLTEPGTQQEAVSRYTRPNPGEFGPPAKDETDAPPSALPRYAAETVRPVTYVKDACEQYEIPIVQSKSVLRRSLGVALTIHLLLFLCVILIIVLPSVVVHTNGDCHLYLMDNLMLDSSRWGPVKNYVHGSPPV